MKFGQAISTTTPIHNIAALATAYYASGYRIDESRRGYVSIPQVARNWQEMAGKSDRSEAVFLTSWAQCGFPRVSLPSKLSASFAATSFSCAEGLELPWGTFVIQIPPDVVFGASPFDAGLPSPISAILVTDQVVGGEVFVNAYGGVGVGMYRLPHKAKSIGDLCENVSDLTEWPPNTNGGWEDEYQLEAIDYRALQCVGRIVLSTIAELSTMPNMPRLGRLGASDLGRLKSGKLPRDSFFQITRDVRVDCRKAVAGYIAGGGTSPAVRSLVRGHWKNQPCGPRHSLRKYIHVEPFWRGPEDAPIAVRSHVLERAS